MMDTDDTLDRCIWLTEEQLDELFVRMEEELKRKMISSEKPRDVIPHGESIRIRNKRKVTNFRKYPFSKWPTKTIYWKFDGEHGKCLLPAYRWFPDSKRILYINSRIWISTQDRHLVRTRRNTSVGHKPTDRQIFVLLAVNRYSYFSHKRYVIGCHCFMHYR